MRVPAGERNRVYLVLLTPGSWSPLFRPGEEVAAALRHDRQRPSTRLVRFNLARRRTERVLFKDTGYCTGLACRSIGDSRSSVLGGTGVGVTGSRSGVSANAASSAGATDASGSYVVLTLKRKLVVWNSAKQLVNVYTHTKPLTTVAVHPHSNMVVTGDAEGMLIMWHELLDADALPVEALVPVVGRNGVAKPRATSTMADLVSTTVVHWHAHPVTCVTFTCDGTLMLSGGAEAVLVLWQLASGAKTFLPRMGAPLRSIGCSPDSKFYSIGLSDSSAVLVDAAGLKRRWRLRGIAIGGHNHRVRKLQAGVLFDARTKSLVMNGSPGRSALQFYDPVLDRHVAEVLTVDRHYVSATDSLRKALPPSAVVLSAFADNGLTMATVDRTPRALHSAGKGKGSGGGGRRRQRQRQHTPPAVAVAEDGLQDAWTLKFWEFREEDGTYALTAVADAPHDAAVTGLAFAPDGRTCVSCSRDGTFKLWARSRRKTIATITAKKKAHHQANRTTWVCRSVGSFRGGLPALAADFSGDGSVLAVAFGHTVTLWLPDTNTLSQCLSLPRPGQAITHLTFVGSSQFLAVATGAELVVWDLVSCSVAWSYRATVTALVVDPAAPVFAPRFAASLFVPSASRKGTPVGGGDEGSPTAQAPQATKKTKTKTKTKTKAQKKRGSSKLEEGAGAVGVSPAELGRLPVAPSSGGNVVAVFSPTSSTPTAVYELGTHTTTSAVVFAPAAILGSKADFEGADADNMEGEVATDKPHLLYALSQDNEVLALVPERLAKLLAGSQSTSSLESAHNTAQETEARRAATFEAVFGARRKRASAAQDVAAAARRDAAVAAQRGAAHALHGRMSSLLEGPSHMLPSMSELFSSFVEATLPKATAVGGASAGDDGSGPMGVGAAAVAGSDALVAVDIDMGASGSDSDSESGTDSDSESDSDSEMDGAMLQVRGSGGEAVAGAAAGPSRMQQERLDVGLATLDIAAALASGMKTSQDGDITRRLGDLPSIGPLATIEDAAETEASVDGAESVATHMDASFQFGGDAAARAQLEHALAAETAVVSANLRWMRPVQVPGHATPAKRKRKTSSASSATRSRPTTTPSTPQTTTAVSRTRGAATGKRSTRKTATSTRKKAPATAPRPRRSSRRRP